MNYIIPLIILGFIVLRIILRLAGNQKPITKSGISILYPLLIYIILITFGTYKLFVNKNGSLILPHVSWFSLITTIFLGCIFAIPVLLTTNYESRQNQIYVKKSKTFIFVIIGMIILRIALRSILANLMPAITFMFLTFVMATIYMMVWRIGCFVKFHRLLNNTTSIP